jgi:hypothetical protein
MAYHYSLPLCTNDPVPEMVRLGSRYGMHLGG